MKKIDISTPKHPNTFTMVDDEDFDFLNQWKWRLNVDGYAVRNQREHDKQCRVSMHREVLQTPSDMISDHINGDRLDNRRENLRICTNAENSRNRGPKVGRELPKGVCWRPKKRRFEARIIVNRRYINIGRFRTASEAAEAYNTAAIKHHGEFARLNSTSPEHKAAAKRAVEYVRERLGLTREDSR